MRECVFSPCRRYRYTLWREWELKPEELFNSGTGSPYADQYLMVIGLNPSTADEKLDDPTIRRCIDFAKRWGFGALCMTNLFAWRDTKPEGMKAHADPIGPDNDDWLARCADAAGMILAAWGKHGSHLRRANHVYGDLSNRFHVLHSLRVNADGTPQHPLYVPATTIPQIYTLPA